MPEQNLVMGVDTSLRSTGIGMVESKGTSMTAVHMQVVRNKPSLPHSACLKNLQEAINQCLEDYAPRSVSIEGGFFLKNAKTAMVLGEARGVVIAACAARDIPVYEYAPRKVKQAIVGTGSAHKEQVARMVATLLGLERPPPDDAADALAMAICHLQTNVTHEALKQDPI